MKKLLYSLIILLATTSIFAQEPLLKMYLQDGSARTYNIDDIENLSFKNSSSDLLIKLYYEKSKDETNK